MPRRVGRGAPLLVSRANDELEHRQSVRVVAATRHDVAHQTVADDALLGRTTSTYTHITARSLFSPPPPSSSSIGLLPSFSVPARTTLRVPRHEALHSATAETTRSVDKALSVAISCASVRLSCPRTPTRPGCLIRLAANNASEPNSLGTSLVAARASSRSSPNCSHSPGPCANSRYLRLVSARLKKKWGQKCFSQNNSIRRHARPALP